LAAREEKKAKGAIEKIKSETKGAGTLEIGILNLANLAQIKTFADAFKSKHNQFDILINNAGVMIPPASKTDDGFELQFGVNFLGHFALTGHLLPLLKSSPNARIVTLSSGAATLTDGIDFENLKLEKPYNEWQSYAVSKLADILFTYELDRKLKAAGLNMLIEIYMAESGILRAEKLAKSKGAENVKEQIAMAQLYLYNAVDIVYTKGKEGIISFAEGDEQRMMLMGL